jgi:hypothetical protein
MRMHMVDSFWELHIFEPIASVRHVKGFQNCFWNYSFVIVCHHVDGRKLELLNITHIGKNFIVGSILNAHKATYRSRKLLFCPLS